MRGKLLITCATALLASTALAFAQGAPERKDRAQPGTSPPAAAQGQPGQPKSKGEQGAQKEDRGPSTSGQAQENREQAPNRAQAPTQRTPNQNRTEGQNQREQPRTQGQAPRNQGETRTPGQTQPTPAPNQPGQNPPGRTQGQAEPRGGGSVTLTTEQRTKIRQTVIEGRNAPRVNRVEFALNVGTVVPKTVHVVEVPETIIEIHPEWRRFLYFVYNDQIVIVEPRTLKIVAVLDV